MTPINTSRQNKILSDELIDNRENLLDLENIKKEDVDLDFPTLIKQARSVACLMHEEKLYQNSDNTWELQLRGIPSLSQYLQLDLDKENPSRPRINLFTSKLRFAKEPVFGFATGFLVRKNKKKAEDEGTKYLVTAAHALCKKGTREIDPEIVKTTRIIFDYYMNEKKEFTKKFDAIYEIEKVVKFKYESHKLGATIGDWALVKLKTAVNRSPLEMEENPAGIKCDTPIYKLGYPMGGPLKYTHSGKTQFIGTNIVKHTLFTFPACSGSPVLNAAGKVIGIIIKGPSAHSIDPRSNQINVSVYDRDTAPFMYAPWFQKITPLCEILNSPPKVVVKPSLPLNPVRKPTVHPKVAVKPSLPLKPSEKPIIPPKERPSTWEEIKNISRNIINAPFAATDDFLEEPSIGNGLKLGITLVGSSLSAGILGTAMIPVTAAASPVVLFGTAVAGLAGTAVTAVGVGATYVTIRRGSI